MPEILVTGATGTFGAAVLEALHQQGTDARAFVRDPSKLTVGDVEVAIGDFADANSLDAALTGVKRVFLASFDTPQALDLQRNVLEAAKRQGVKHVVRISTIGVDDPRLGPIMTGHANGERQLENSEIAFTHLRPSWVLQNFLPTSSATPVRDGKIRLPAADGKVGFVDARDVAAVAAVALTNTGHEGRAYELTGPDARSHAEVANALAEASGTTISFEDIPPQIFAQELLEAGWKPSSVDSFEALFSEIREGDAAIVTDDVVKVTGRSAYSIFDFAANHAHLFAS